jgi:hypothetical protein
MLRSALILQQLLDLVLYFDIIHNKPKVKSTLGHCKIIKIKNMKEGIPRDMSNGLHRRAFIAGLGSGVAAGVVVAPVAAVATLAVGVKLEKGDKQPPLELKDIPNSTFTAIVVATGAGVGAANVVSDFVEKKVRGE